MSEASGFYTCWPSYLTLGFDNENINWPKVKEMRRCWTMLQSKLHTKLLDETSGFAMVDPYSLRQGQEKYSMATITFRGVTRTIAEGSAESGYRSPYAFMKARVLGWPDANTDELLTLPLGAKWSDKVGLVSIKVESAAIALGFHRRIPEWTPPVRGTWKRFCQIWGRIGTAIIDGAPLACVVCGKGLGALGQYSQSQGRWRQTCSSSCASKIINRNRWRMFCRFWSFLARVMRGEWSLSCVACKGFIKIDGVPNSGELSKFCSRTCQSRHLWTRPEFRKTVTENIRGPRAPLKKPRKSPQRRQDLACEGLGQ